MKFEIVPVSLRQAREFCDEHHRHNVGSKGHKFSIGLSDGQQLVGVATVGRPIARHNDDGLTAEITRVCVLPGTKNGNSMLYAACFRAAKAMGYRKVITYTLQTESCASLRAAWFEIEAETKVNKRQWDRGARHREPIERCPNVPKWRWVKK